MKHSKKNSKNLRKKMGAMENFEPRTLMAADAAHSVESSGSDFSNTTLPEVNIYTMQPEAPAPADFTIPEPAEQPTGVDGFPNLSLTEMGVGETTTEKPGVPLNLNAPAEFPAFYTTAAGNEPSTITGGEVVLSGPAPVLPVEETGGELTVLGGELVNVEGKDIIIPVSSDNGVDFTDYSKWQNTDHSNYSQDLQNFLNNWLQSGSTNDLQVVNPEGAIEIYKHTADGYQYESTTETNSLPAIGKDEVVIPAGPTTPAPVYTNATLPAIDAVTMQPVTPVVNLTDTVNLGDTTNSSLPAIDKDEGVIPAGPTTPAPVYTNATLPAIDLVTMQPVTPIVNLTDAVNLGNTTNSSLPATGNITDSNIQEGDLDAAKPIFGPDNANWVDFGKDLIEKSEISTINGSPTGKATYAIAYNKIPDELKGERLDFDDVNNPVIQAFKAANPGFYEVKIIDEAGDEHIYKQIQPDAFKPDTYIEHELVSPASPAVDAIPLNGSEPTQPIDASEIVELGLTSPSAEVTEELLIKTDEGHYSTNYAEWPDELKSGDMKVDEANFLKAFEAHNPDFTGVLTVDLGDEKTDEFFVLSKGDFDKAFVKAPILAPSPNGMGEGIPIGTAFSTSLEKISEVAKIGGDAGNILNVLSAIARDYPEVKDITINDGEKAYSFTISDDHSITAKSKDAANLNLEGVEPSLVAQAVEPVISFVSSSLELAKNTTGSLISSAMGLGEFVKKQVEGTSWKDAITNGTSSLVASGKDLIEKGFSFFNGFGVRTGGLGMTPIPANAAIPGDNNIELSYKNPVDEQVSTIKLPIQQVGNSITVTQDALDKQGIKMNAAGHFLGELAKAAKVNEITFVYSSGKSEVFKYSLEAPENKPNIAPAKPEQVSVPLDIDTSNRGSTTSTATVLPGVNIKTVTVEYSPDGKSNVKPTASAPDIGKAVAASISIPLSGSGAAPTPSTVEAKGESIAFDYQDPLGAGLKSIELSIEKADNGIKVTQDALDKQGIKMNAAGHFLGELAKAANVKEITFVYSNGKSQVFKY